MNKRKFLIIYIILSIIYICSTLANLVLPVWFQYCYWDFGLITGYSFTDIKDFSNEQLIVAIQVEACGSLESFISHSCDNICNKVHNFRIGGILLIAFALSSCISTMLCIFFSARVLSDSSLQIKSMSLFMFFPFVFMTAGLSCYVGLCDFLKINDKGEFDNISRQFSLKIGLFVAIFNYSLCFLVLVFGFTKCRKLITSKPS